MKRKLTGLYLRVCLTILFSLVLINAANSQNDFREGYAIDKNQDTIWGYVNYREGNSKYHDFEFKKSINESVRKMNPEQSMGYGFTNDKSFMRLQLKIEDPTEAKFFEILVKGQMSLLRYESRFFLSDEFNGVKELTNEKQEVEIEGKLYSKNSNRYQGVLTLVMENCNSILSKIKKTRFNEKDLTELVNYYNKCIGENSYSLKESKAWSKFRLGLSVGYNYSTLQTKSGLDSEYYLQNNFDPANSFMPGLFFELSSPRLNERLSLYSGVFYLQSSYVMNGYVPSPFSNKRDYVLFDVEQIKIPFGIRYTFPTKKVTPFINLGALFSWQTSYEFYRLQEIESNNIVSTFEPEAPEIENNQLGIWGGVGLYFPLLEKSELFTELRYDLSSGYFSPGLGGTIQDGVSNLQLHLGIRF